MGSLNYKPDGETLKNFLKDNNFLRGLRGPVGSGKSVACCIEVFRRALAQKKSPDGIRKSRVAIVRMLKCQMPKSLIAVEQRSPPRLVGSFHSGEQVRNPECFKFNFNKKLI